MPEFCDPKGFHLTGLQVVDRYKMRMKRRLILPDSENGQRKRNNDAERDGKKDETVGQKDGTIFT